MNKLIKTMDNLTYTENKALTHKSTLSPLLDLFSSIGAMRNRPEKSVLDTFTKSFNAEPLLTLKALFYARDIRGGQGERKTFRAILKHLANNNPELVIKNLENIVEFGRWDDVFSLIDTSCENEVLKFVATQLITDVAMLAKNKPVSLLGKWMPSENTSSKVTQALALKIRNFLNTIGEKFNSKDYRKILSALRKSINIVETPMCANEWDKIEFGKLPSLAGLKYRKAFYRHEKERYEQFLTNVKEGKEKVNASVLYPYDVIRNIMSGMMTFEGAHPTGHYYCGVKDLSKEEINTLDVFWNALPNYLENNAHNGIVVADTSGSMNGLPICVSISLAIYFAERNKGQFKNHFMTFSANPQMQEVVGDNIVEKAANLSKSEWGTNTNIQRVFDLILDVGRENKVPQEDMPETIYVVSDMEFDTATTKNTRTNFQEIKRKYTESGYIMPELVFWNVNSRNQQVPITIDESRGAKLVSGCNPNILKNLLEGKTMTAEEMMLSVLNQERYNKVTL